MDDYENVLRKLRLRYEPPLPQVLVNLAKLGVNKGEPSVSLSDQDAVRHHFPKTYGQPQVSFETGEQSPQQKPLKVGVVLSGGQAPGGHNVIAGLFDALKELHAGSTLLGFLNGPGGIIKGQVKELDASLIAEFRNLGGFDMIGSGRTKIESDEQFKASLDACLKFGLDGLVIIGGDDSNTNAAFLAEYFLQRNCPTRVVGVPKTIDGDLKSETIEISFGHDTACRVYSELIGNLMRDALSARKYYHFIKLMGRSASHIALECALTTHPNMVLISEEVAEKRQTLAEIIANITNVVIDRAKAGKQYGVILVPEGLIEFVPEIGKLIRELNGCLSDPAHSGSVEERTETKERVAYLLPHLSSPSQACLKSLPEGIQAQLLFDRDPHGNVQVSRIDTEHLLMATVREELKRRGHVGAFNAIAHFFGYEGRSAMPSLFDCHYCQALGYGAALLISNGLTGYMSTVHGLTTPVEEWTIGGTPLTMMMNLEERKGKRTAVIKKALVDLHGAAFSQLAKHRPSWAIEDLYGYPGPIQFFGPAEVSERLPLTLRLEHN